MIDLKEGEIICDRCNGTGYRDISNIPVRYNRKTGLPFFESTSCTICKGTGKLDWIDNVFGKEDDYSYDWNSMAVNSDTTYVMTSDGSVWKQVSEKEGFIKES